MRIFTLSLLVAGAITLGQAQPAESGAYSIAISEFNYNSDKFNNSSDWVELHNYGGTAQDLSNWKLKDAIGTTFTIPGGTSLSAGSYLVLVERTDTFAMIHPTVTNYIGNLGFGLNNNSGSIRLFDAGGAIVKQINYVDSIPWPKGSDGYGPSVQILDELASETDGNNWIAGCILGTPGSAYVPCDYDIVVSEINYNSLPAYNPGDWIELYNRSTSNIGIGGWTLRDNRNGNAFLIPNGTTLNAGARLVITDSLESFNILFAGVTNVIGEPTFNFSNGGDAIRIYEPGDKLKYSIRYKDSAPWPLDPDGTGFTLELVDDGGNPNVATSWVAGCLYGSPGTPFIFPCPDAVTNMHPGDIVVGPVPFTSGLHISLASGNIIDQYKVIDLQGNVVFTQTVNAQFSIWDGTNVNGTEVPAGIYVISIIDNNGAIGNVRVVKAL